MSYIEELFGLKNKNAVVIGGAGMLGGAISEGLAKAGANVAILGRNIEKAQKKAKSIASETNVKAIAFKADVVKKDDIITAHEKIKNELGRVHILINAPGMTSKTPIFNLTAEEWDEIMNVNLRGMVFSCQVFGEDMVRAKEGSIINISSVASGPPLSKVYTYSASKAGVNSITQSLAIEWASTNVRVNAIVPGFFPAELNRKMLTKERVENIMNHTPLKRFGKSEELVAVAIWLASDRAASFVTGSIISVDGGFTATTI